MKIIWIWTKVDDGKTLDRSGFETKDLAIESLKYSSHGLKEKPKKVMDSRDEETYQMVEIWDAPLADGDQIRWARLKLELLQVWDEVVCL